MDIRRCIADNPFYVLELRPDATAVEVERAGQRLLAMIEVGLAAASSYPTPLGGMPRDADLVRRSLDELRDPERRIVHEVWAALDPSVEARLDREPACRRGLPPWPGALATLGFGRSS